MSDRRPARARPRRLAAALACVLAAVAGAAATQTASAAEGAEQPPPIPPVVSVVDLGLVGQNEHVLCRDGMYSALVRGRSVWSFGDTCLDDGGELGDTFIENSLAATGDLDASGGIALTRDREDAEGVPVQFLPLTQREIAFGESHEPNEIAIWPGPLVNDPERNRVLCFYVTVYRGPQIGFDTVGGGIAVANPRFTKVTRPVQTLDPDAPEPTYMWGKDEQQYTNGTLVVDDMLYAYGSKGKGLSTLVRVARVPLADALDKTKWRYWNGTEWSTENADQATVYVGGPAGDTLFWDDYLGMYVTVFQPFVDNNVYYRVANHPEGPWSDKALLFTAEEGTDVSYAARVHPEFAAGNGRTQYVSYVKNTGFLRQEQPLVQVTFGKR